MKATDVQIAKSIEPLSNPSNCVEGYTYWLAPAIAWRSRSLLLVLGLQLVGACWLACASNANADERVSPPQANPLFPPEMNAVAVAKGDVIGDLGGVAVRIPPHFANYVEYDGDPGFGEKRQGPVPQRNFQSKLMSFGFEVRFPDMAGRTSPELWQDYRSKLRRESQWMSVGVTSGQHYYGDGYLDQFVDSTLKFKPGERFPALAYQQYGKLQEPEYGLTVYAPVGMDPKTLKPYRDHQNAKDLFVMRNTQGKVVAAIECDNRNINPGCSHDFSMEPTMTAAISVRYRRGMLLHWKEIQTSIIKLTESFESHAESDQAMKPR